MVPPIKHIAARNGAEHPADHNQQTNCAGFFLRIWEIAEHHLAEKRGNGVEDAHVDA